MNRKSPQQETQAQTEDQLIKSSFTKGKSRRSKKPEIFVSGGVREFQFADYFKHFVNTRVSFAMIDSPFELLNLTINMVYGDDSLSTHQRRSLGKVSRLDPLKAFNPINAIYGLAFFSAMGIKILIDKIDKAITGAAPHTPSSKIAAVVKSVLTFPFGVITTAVRMVNDAVKFVAKGVIGIFLPKVKDKNEAIELSSTDTMRARAALSKKDKERPQVSEEFGPRSTVNDLPDVRVTSVKAAVYGSTAQPASHAPVVENDKVLKK